MFFFHTGRCGRWSAAAEEGLRGQGRGEWVVDDLDPYAHRITYIDICIYIYIHTYTHTCIHKSMGICIWIVTTHSHGDGTAAARRAAGEEAQGGAQGGAHGGAQGGGQGGGHGRCGRAAHAWGGHVVVIHSQPRPDGPQHSICYRLQ